MTYVLSPTPAVPQTKTAAWMTLGIVGTPAHMGVQPTFSTTRACAFTLPSERTFDCWVDVSPKQSWRETRMNRDIPSLLES